MRRRHNENWYLRLCEQSSHPVKMRPHLRRAATATFKTRLRCQTGKARTGIFLWETTVGVIFYCIENPIRAYDGCPESAVLSEKAGSVKEKTSQEKGKTCSSLTSC